MTNNFWAERLAAPAPETPMSATEQYRAWQRAKTVNGASGSRIYDAPAAPKARLQLYDPEAPGYQGIGSYVGRKNDPLARKPGESAIGWSLRAGRLLAHVPDEQAAAVRAAIDQALAQETPGDHGALRKQLDARVDGTGYGFDGSAESPYQRAARMGRGFGDRKIEANGHLVSSAAAINEVMWRREAEQRGQLPQRTEAPTASTGEGWMVR